MRCACAHLRVRITFCTVATADHLPPAHSGKSRESQTFQAIAVRPHSTCSLRRMRMRVCLCASVRAMCALCVRAYGSERGGHSDSLSSRRTTLREPTVSDNLSTVPDYPCAHREVGQPNRFVIAVVLPRPDSPTTCKCAGGMSRRKPKRVENAAFQIDPHHDVHDFALRPLCVVFLECSACLQRCTVHARDGSGGGGGGVAAAAAAATVNRCALY